MVLIVVTLIVAAITAEICHVMLKYNTGDFPTHLQWAVFKPEQSYSLLDVLYRMAWSIYPEGKGATFVVVVIVAVGFIFSAVFIKALIPSRNYAAASVCALLAYLMDPVFCPGWNSSFVIGVQAGAIWHNPTYLGIKAVLPIGLFFLFRIFHNIGKTVFNIIGLTAACTVGTAIKPNFTLCFEAALFCVVIFIFFCKKKKTTPVPMLLSMVPSVVILVAQYSRAFQGANAGSGIAVAPFMILRRYAEHPVMSVFQSLAFSLFVLFLLRREVWKEPVYVFVWVMTVIAYAESFLLIETGSRMYDGNWTWGADLSNYGLYLISIPFFARYFVDAIKKHDARKIAVGSAGVVLLAWHFLSGVAYLTLVFERKTVWL